MDPFFVKLVHHMTYRSIICETYKQAIGSAKHRQGELFTVEVCLLHSILHSIPIWKSDW